MERKFTLERMFKIWDGLTGEHIEVGHVRGSVGFVEIQCWTKSHGISDSMVIDKAQAVLVAKALLELTEESS